MMMPHFSVFVYFYKNQCETSVDVILVSVLKLNSILAIENTDTMKHFFCIHMLLNDA